MKLDELRTSLYQLADEAPTREGDARARLSGVDRKIAHARRVKVVGGVAAVAVAAGLVAAAPSLLDDQRSAPVERPDKEARFVEDGGVRFYADAAGARLIAHAVGEPGQTKVALTAVPESFNLAAAEQCFVDGSVRGEDAAQHPWLHVRINGREINSVSCEVGTGLPREPIYDNVGKGSGSPESSERLWRRLGVETGQEMDIELTLTGRAAELRRTTLAFGLYEREPAVLRDGIWLRPHELYDGKEYEFVDVDVADLEQLPMVLSVERETRETDVLVMFGAERLSRRVTLRSPGSPFYQLAPPGGGGGVLRPPGDGPLTVRATGRTREGDPGLIYLAQYRPID